MAKKLTVDKNIALINKGIEDNKVVIGTDKTLKELKNGNLSKVYITSNCADDVKSDLDNYGKLLGTDIIHLPYPNDEFAVMCKKPFSISVLGIMKE